MLFGSVRFVFWHFLLKLLRQQVYFLNSLIFLYDLNRNFCFILSDFLPIESLDFEKMSERSLCTKSLCTNRMSEIIGSSHLIFIKINFCFFFIDILNERNFAEFYNKTQQNFKSFSSSSPLFMHKLSEPLNFEYRQSCLICGPFFMSFS